jgi:hypothetical protein
LRKGGVIVLLPRSSKDFDSATQFRRRRGLKGADHYGGKFGAQNNARLSVGHAFDRVRFDTVDDQGDFDEAEACDGDYAQPSKLEEASNCPWRSPENALP